MASSATTVFRNPNSFPNENIKLPSRTSIDRRNATRIVPMKVLCLGCSRTGTATLRNALLRLGYIDTYHGFSLTLENPADGRIWLEAQCPRINKHSGRPFSRAHFDQVLGHCQAAADFPCIAFSEELMRLYPDAKVILSTRDEGAWVRSMRVLYHSFENPSWRLGKLWARLLGTEQGWALAVVDTFCVGFYGKDLEGEGRARYREQNDLVRRVCAETPGRLLEWKLEDGKGWSELCDFLGESVPECAFPRGNDTGAYWQRMRVHEAFMGREWKARRVLWLIDHYSYVVSIGMAGLLMLGGYRWLRGDSLSGWSWRWHH